MYRQWFLKCGPQTSRISVTWERVGNRKFQALVQNYSIRCFKVESSNLHFSQAVQMIVINLKFENHHSRLWEVADWILINIFLCQNQHLHVKSKKVYLHYTLPVHWLTVIRITYIEKSLKVHCSSNARIFLF